MEVSTCCLSPAPDRKYISLVFVWLRRGLSNTQVESQTLGSERILKVF